MAESPDKRWGIGPNAGEALSGTVHWVRMLEIGPESTTEEH